MEGRGGEERKKRKGGRKGRKERKIRKSSELLKRFCTVKKCRP